MLRRTSLLGLALASSWAQAAALPPDLQTVTVASGFTTPIGVRHAGDARLFVIEQGGAIKIISGGTVLGTPFLRIANSTGGGATRSPLGFVSGGEQGLLGLAFAPDYATSGLFYISYSDAAGDTVIARYSVDAMNANLANPDSGAVVLRVDQDFSNHNGGDIHFGPDGFLYIALGDGGSGNDPCNRGQTLQAAQLNNSGSCAVDSAFSGNGGRADSRALLGKLLRIDVSQNGSEAERCGLATGTSTTPATPSVGYRIPAGNPYAAAADGICDEVFVAGLRNPWRFSFDRLSNDLWIGDVGQGAREEVDLIPAGQSGLNFGWKCREGLIAGNTCSGNLPLFTDPVLDYPRDVGASITGGYRYRGPQQALHGIYFYADFVSGRQLAGLRNSSGGFDARIWRATGGNPSSFGEGANGEMYLVDYGGTVSRLSTALLFHADFESD